MNFTSRILIEKYLSGYGSTDSVGDGEAAVEAFRRAVEKEEPYDLVCLDIMLPKMDGQEVLKKLRGLESEYNIAGGRAAKIIMTTALGDPQNIITCLPRAMRGVSDEAHREEEADSGNYETRAYRRRSFHVMPVPPGTAPDKFLSQDRIVGAPVSIPV